MVLFIRFFCAVALAAVGACVMVAWTNTYAWKNYWPLNAAIGLVGGFCVGLVGAKLIEVGLPDDK